MAPEVVWDDRYRRFEEVGSDEDELAMGDRRMVLKDSALAPKRRRGKQQQQQQRSAKFTSDELFFNDDFQDNGLAYGEDYRSSGSEGEYAGALIPARSRREDNALLDQALERIQRAKAKGKPSVSLTHEELAALERRNSGPGDADRPRSSRNKPRREDSGSSSNTSPNNDGRNRNKKPSRPSSGFFGSSNSPRPTSKRSSKAMRSDTEGRPSTRGREDTPPRASRPAPVAYYNSRADRRAASGDEGRRKPAPSLRERYSDEHAYAGQPSYRAYNPNMSAPRDRDVDRGYRSDAGYRAAGDSYRNPRASYPLPDDLVQYEI
ncbi:MAG: hypothetical protein INR71_10170, partial [Terriglobus roseus]|nr:hypothetical protein [Terriglobus roseus]